MSTLVNAEQVSPSQWWIVFKITITVLWKQKLAEPATIVIYNFLFRFDRFVVVSSCSGTV